MSLSQQKTLAEAANSNDIEALYILLKQNPSLLEEIDAIPFVDTPLHLAAASGSTHFAIEVLNLKPSFGKKLNPDGFSSMHVAMRSGKTQTVRRLVYYDSELIRVNGREGCTPLHYVVEVDDLDLLALFLEANPNAIRYLNIRGETAVHVAVKSGNLNAFKVLLGWLKHTENQYILNVKDENGNGALHIAVSTNDYEMVRLLIPVVRGINKQNKDGLTALDIARGVPNNVANARKIENKLLSAGAKTRTQLPPSQTGSTVSHYTDLALGKFSPKIFFEYNLKRAIMSSVESFSEGTRSNLLVVTGLIITATYQAILSPPGGLTSGDGNNDTSVFHNTFLDMQTTNATSLPGKLNMGMEWYALMLGCNSFSFALSMGCLILLLPHSVFIMLYVGPLMTLSVSYGFSYGIINPLRRGYTTMLLGAVFGILNIPFVWLKFYS